ncbi:MAG: hypothetical protein U0R81_00040 [Mycobacterium sp.]
MTSVAVNPVAWDSMSHRTSASVRPFRRPRSKSVRAAVVAVIARNGRQLIWWWIEAVDCQAVASGGLRINSGFAFLLTYLSPWRSAAEIPRQR